MIIILFGAVWYVVGIAGFIYWWTSDYDLDVSDAVFSLVAGLMGPIAWLAGWDVHGKAHRKVVLMRRRS